MLQLHAHKQKAFEKATSVNARRNTNGCILCGRPDNSKLKENTKFESAMRDTPSRIAVHNAGALQILPIRDIAVVCASVMQSQHNMVSGKCSLTRWGHRRQPEAIYERLAALWIETAHTQNSHTAREKGRGEHKLLITRANITRKRRGF